jgi:hypothetical protein
MIAAALAPRPALATDGALCTAGWVVTLSAGFTMSTAKATYNTYGDPAYMECVGWVAGDEITGPADYDEEGTVEGSCSGGRGTGTFRASIPTKSGVRTVEGPFTVTWAGPQGYFQGPQWSGSFEFYPVEGDCVNAPARRARVLNEGVLNVSG